MVRDVFRLAKQNAPAIIFVDEVDAIATARFDAQTGADRRVGWGRFAPAALPMHAGCIWP
jgi:ATP-dependent 26S proteasome regulatory subunit